MIKGRKKAHQITLIGGKWRGRRLTVVDAPDLRPTPSRVRETLFNWLQPYILNARCLDLFAGSGALGLEALSRGARHVTFVEKSALIFQALRIAVKRLNAQSDVIHADALQWLAQNQQPAFDIIFLDPPFTCNLLLPTLAGLANSDLITPRLIYLETPQKGEFALPPTWQIIKQKTAGAVAYHLIQENSSCRST